MPDGVSSAKNASGTAAAAGSFVPSRLKRESMPRDDALPVARVLASAASSDPTPRLKHERDPPTKTEPSMEDRTDRNTNNTTAISPSTTGSAPAIALSSSSLVPSNVTSSTSATLPSNENNNDAVPDPFVSSSPLPDFSGSFSPTNSSSSLPTITEATRKFGGEYSRDCKRCRKWKSGDWCWLKEGEDVKEKQGGILAEDINIEVEQEQETAVSPETTMPSPKPINTHPNAKESRHSSCLQAKRKAAAAISFAVDDEDYEGDIPEYCKKDDGLAINDCSNSGIQGPKTKKARKGSHQDMLDKKWDAMYQSLLEYKAQHDNTLVPKRYDKNPQLGIWVGTQRKLHSKKELLRDRFLRLQSIGFAWCLNKQVLWESMFQLLKEYKVQHDNTLVPQRYDKNPQLANWVGTQRKLHSKKELLRDRFLRLQSIGFVWCLKKQVPWESMFQLLKEYKAQYDNTLVPKRYDKNPQLANWVRTQRNLHSKKELLRDRVLRLQSIGFVWCFNKQVLWESMFQLLKEYKAQYGNTLVPKRYDKNPQLGNWVNTQRNLHSKKELLRDRVLRLESIGFVWCLWKQVPWESMFQLLKEYKTKHGNTLVPSRYNKNPQLGNWVNTQRNLHSKKELLSDRVLLLESIGFV